MPLAARADRERPTTSKSASLRVRHLHGPELRHGDRERHQGPLRGAERVLGLGLADLVRRGALLWLVVLVGACAPLERTPAVPTPKPPYTLAPATPVTSLEPIRTVGPAGHGRPYTAEMMAVALREAASYGTFPSVLQTPWLAEVLADRIWTYDGLPYRELSIDGDCTESRPDWCDLSVNGLPGFAASRDEIDVYFFPDVRPAESFIEDFRPQSLGGFPSALVPELDALVRSLDTKGRLSVFDLRSVSWALPPPDDGYILNYRRGDLEAATLLRVTVDRRNRTILSMIVTQCGDMPNCTEGPVEP